jgi:spore germination cell wall hydrolase CwlJ-like protein
MTLHPNDAKIKEALSHVQVVGMTIWAEARAEPIEGEIAVGCVIRNRLLRPKRFADTWAGVCLAKWQFSCWIPQGGEQNYRMLMAKCEAALAGTQPWPKQQLWIAAGIITGELEEDRVHGADHYYASWMSTPPKWSEGLTPTAIIGVHRFYKVP